MARKGHEEFRGPDGWQHVLDIRMQLGQIETGVDEVLGDESLVAERWWIRGRAEDGQVFHGRGITMHRIVNGKLQENPHLYPRQLANHYTPDMVRLPFAADGVVHGVFMGLGIVIALLFYAYERRRRGLTDPRLWTIAGFAVAFGALGSRLLTWDAAREPSLAQWWVTGDRSVLAGLVGAWIGVHVGKRLTGYRQPTGDLFAPAVALAMVFGRIGCLLTEQPGTPTGGAWGMLLTPAQASLVGGPAGVGLHPSFLYEMVFHAAAFAAMWHYRDRLPRPGDLFICYVTAYALFRFAVEFVRGNEVLFVGLSGPQWFLVVALPLLLWRSWLVFTRPLRPELEGSTA